MLDAGLISTFAILAVLILVGTAVIVWMRRWIRRDPETEPFTFQDLRDMKARGEINEREFAIMRAALLDRMGLREGPHESDPPRRGSGAA